LTGADTGREMRRQKSGIRYTDDTDEIRQLDPYRIAEKVREVEGDPDAMRNELPALPLPGHGDEYDDCGDDVPHFCADCGDPVITGRTCYRKRCPRCAPAWVTRRATAAGAKLEAVRRYLYAKRGESPRFHHLVFSPPEGFSVSRDDPLDAGYEVVKELLDELGLDGGAIVYHPWRGDGGDDRGFWSELLFNGNDWGETVQELSHEPHFHVIGVGRYVPGGNFTDAVYQQTGWTFKRITKGGDESESNVSLYDEYDLARALTYSLSHAGICDDKNAYRYTGMVAGFSADDDITAEIDEVVRSVAPNTLGLSYSTTSCSRTVDDDEDGSTGTTTETGTDRGVSADEGGENARCGGRVVRIANAPEYLKNREWVDEARCVDGLIDYLRGEPPPD
jgi:hypothetical protein